MRDWDLENNFQMLYYAFNPVLSSPHHYPSMVGALLLYSLYMGLDIVVDPANSFFQKQTNLWCK